MDLIINITTNVANGVVVTSNDADLAPVLQAISDQEEKIMALLDQLTALAGQVSDLQATASATSDQTSQLAADVARIAADFDALSAAVSAGTPEQQAAVSALGDSIAAAKDTLTQIQGTEAAATADIDDSDVPPAA